MLRLSVVTAALALCLASAVHADYVEMPIKWDNGLPNPDPEALDWSSDIDALSIVGDDFLCNDPYPITQVQWWGSLMVTGVPMQQPDFWRFSWWQYRAPGEDGIQFSHPGLLLLWNDVYDYTSQIWDDSGEETIYHYYTRLPGSCEFWQEPGNMYFLAIQAGWYEPVGQIWGWHESLNQWNDDAVQADLAGMIGFDPVTLGPIERDGVSRDMAFQLGIPEPSTAAMLLFGAALLWGRRRRTLA